MKNKDGEWKIYFFVLQRQSDGRNWMTLAQVFPSQPKKLTTFRKKLIMLREHIKHKPYICNVVTDCDCWNFSKMFCWHLHKKIDLLIGQQYEVTRQAMYV